MKDHFRLFSGVVSLFLLFFCSSESLARTEGNASAPKEIQITVTKTAFEPSQITVHKGERLKLIVKSVEMAHKFAISDFGIALEINKGATESVEFTPDKEGNFTFFCTICGDEHPDMAGKLTVSGDSITAVPGMQVQFDPNAPGVVYVEVNGARVRIDTNTRAVARVEEQNSPPTDAIVTNAVTNTVTSTIASNNAGKVNRSGGSAQDTTFPAQPYDYQLINVPTPKRVPKGSLNVHFTHRFSSTITGQGQDFEDVASNLAGLDSFSVSSLAFTYGFTERFYGKFHRSPICDSAALCKTIEMGLGYHLLSEAGKSPVALSLYGSIEGNDNFTENFVYNAQVMVGRSITEYVHVFFSPAVHFKTNGYGRFNPRPGRFFNDEEIVRDFSLGQHTGSFGFGVNGRITKTSSLLFEYVPRVGFKLGRVEPVFDNNFNLIAYNNRSFPSIAFGIEKRLSRHAFALTFSNTQTSTTSRYNSSNNNLPRDRFVIGFNLYRRLF